MRVLVFAVLLTIAHATVDTCAKLTTCAECDSHLVEGSQTCSWCVNSQACGSVDSLGCLFGTTITKVSDCPVSVKHGFEYEDRLARNEMLALSAAAYSSSPQVCLTNAVHGAKLIRQINVGCDLASNDLCSAFSAVSHYNKAVVLSFRGTAGTIQLFLEGAETILAAKVSLASGGKVSKYFFDGFKALWSAGLMEDVVKAISENPSYDLWITGHSLGGSMASIAATTIATRGILPGNRIKLMTFGQPRTGDHDFVTIHDSVLPYTYRVVHEDDIVPHLPSRDFENYHHHRYEVWYDNDMKPGDSYKMCLTPDDNGCSDSNTVDLSVEHHLHYFGKTVSGFGRDGCV